MVSQHLSALSLYTPSWLWSCVLVISVYAGKAKPGCGACKPEGRVRGGVTSPCFRSSMEVGTDHSLKNVLFPVEKIKFEYTESGKHVQYALKVVW